MSNSGRPHITYSKDGSTTVTRLVKNQKIGTMAADDVHGHGTGVASIVAGYKWNTASADHGHAPDASIAGYAIANDASGNSSLSNMVTAYSSVVADRVTYNLRASILALTGSPDPLSVEQQAADAAALADILICTAAGNTGTGLTNSQINLNGLSVGAVNENVKAVAIFSSRGFIHGGNMPFPAIVANGVDTNIALRNNEGADYVSSGTSMAAAMVCGAATQLRARYPVLTALEMKASLLASAQASPGTGANQVSTGPGVGYLHNAYAHSIAALASRFGTASVTTASTIWTRSLSVTANGAYQLAIAWNRLNPSLASWSNLNLEIRDGATLVASSRTPSSTFEFVRFTAPTTGVYTIRVIAAGFASGVTTQPFAWASLTDTGVFTSGTYTPYGVGCKGSGTGSIGHVVVPAAYATKWGEAGSNYPHGRPNTRYQQVFLGSEVGSRILTGCAFREDNAGSGPGGTMTLSVWLGGTGTTPDTLVTQTRGFGANFDAAPKLVFSGTWSYPAFATANTNLAAFKPQIPFSTPYAFDAHPGRNLLFQLDNTSSGADIVHPFDSTVNANTSRILASPVANNPTTFERAGLVMCFFSNGLVLPAGYVNAMGGSANSLPFASNSMRYQQVFDWREAGSGTLTSLSLRQSYQAIHAATQTLSIHLGYSSLGLKAQTSTYDNNWIAGTKKTVFSGNVSYLPLSGANTSPSTFGTTIVFTTPFVHVSQPNRNFLMEVVNTSASGVSSGWDAVAFTDRTARLFGPATAATGTLDKDYGLVIRFNSGEPGIPAIGNVGVPEVYTSFQITLSNAKPLTAAALWMGFTQVNVPLPAAMAPGCTLWTTADVFPLWAGLTNVTGFAMIPVAVPYEPTLIGGRFFNEWLIFDPGQNKLGMVFSNAGAGRIGGAK